MSDPTFGQTDIVKLSDEDASDALLERAVTGAAVQTPEVPGWEWKRITRTGDVIHGIVDAAHKTGADLVVMSTDGRSGFLDALRGSHTERVLNQVPAPLLAVPEGSTAEAHLKMGAR